jgi:cytochrome c peroxidase
MRRFGNVTRRSTVACMIASIALVSLAAACGTSHEAKGPSESAAAPTKAAPTAQEAPAPVQASLVVKRVKADASAEPLQPIPSIEALFEELEIDFDPKKVELGRKLFHDPRLSNDDTLSCASCHDLRYAGADRAISATGVRGQIGPINTPTVFNSVFGISQFWDGRAASLEAQADGPPNAAGEMGSSWPQILGKLKRDATIVEAFQAVYPEIKSGDDLKTEQVLSSIADFERTLVTPDGRFDRYLKGDIDALTDEEYSGYQLFKSSGCTTCHYGVAAGGKAFQPLGAKRNYFEHRLPLTHVDMGRFNVTKDERDRHVFKVPTLRNVELTAPYFHDGSQPTLEAAVRSMSRYQLDKEMSDEEISLIVQFLKTLTGEYTGKSLADHQNTKR